MFYTPNYEHIKCDQCGGIIGEYDRERFSCDRCGKEFKLYELNYHRLLINDKTGWVFPVVDKEN